MNKKTPDQILQDLKKRHSSLILVKKPLEPVIDELITFANPTRREINDTDDTAFVGEEVFDGTANSANKIMADGLFGNLCSQSLRWFASILPVKMAFPKSSKNMRQWDGKRLDDMPEVKRWLESTDDLLYSDLLGSNFYDEMPVFLRDGGSVGGANMYTEYDLKESAHVFTVLHPREYVIALNKFGRADTEFRTYKLTIRQLVDKFGMKTLTPEIPGLEQLYENSPYTEKDVIHAVLPRADFDPKMRDVKNKPWASYWYLDGGRTLLLESGYDSFPFIHWQYNRGNRGYGSGPGHEAYVAIQTGNQQAMSNLIAGQKMVEPPMVAHSSLRGRINRGPKGLTVVDDMGMRPVPLVEGLNLPYALDMLDRQRKIIEEKWHTDFFMMLSRAAFDRLDITATQVMEMTSEKATMLGTVIGRISNDVLNPLIDLIFAQEQKQGRIPMPPQIMLDLGLTEVTTRIDYTGPLAQAQKRAHSTQGIRTGLAFIGEVSAIFPDAIHKVKWDDTITRGMTDLGFPASCLNTTAEFEQILSANAQSQQQAQTMLQLSQAADMMPKLGKAIEPNSPAEGLIAAAGGQGIPQPQEGQG
jgi:hypothetical protein